MSKNLVQNKTLSENILLVSEYYPPHWTGLSNSFHILAQNLQAQGHSVEVLTTQFDRHTKRQDVIDGVPVFRVPYQIKISRTHYSIKIVWEFIKKVSSKSVVIINSPNSNILFYSILAKMFGKKLSIYHQADILLPRQTGNRLVHYFIERIFDLSTIPSVLLADTISSFTRDYASFSRVLRFGLYKFRPYIPHVTLSKETPTTQFKNRLDVLAKKHTLIGISGRFVEEKGFDVLFQAIPLILKKVPNAHIIFAGKKVVEYEPFYERHKALFENEAKHVTFLGLLAGGNYAYFYGKLKVFVLSSRIECFALTQIEAVRKKIPIVVTNVAGARMLVKSSGFGEIAEREDPISLAEAIVKVITNHTAYAKNHSEAVAFLEKYQDFRL